MEPVATNIVTAADRMLGLADSLLQGVTAGQFARFATPGGKTIVANHGAFIFGHLSLYPARIMTAAGLDSAGIAPPESYTELFEHGAECKDDPKSLIYPAMGEVVGVFTEGHRVLSDQIKTWTDSQLAAGHALEGGIAEVFPTLGQLANFILVGHTYMHLGQMSTWRRAIGLGPAM